MRYSPPGFAPSRLSVAQVAYLFHNVRMDAGALTIAEAAALLGVTRARIHPSCLLRAISLGRSLPDGGRRKKRVGSGLTLPRLAGGWEDPVHRDRSSVRRAKRDFEMMSTGSRSH
jgi:hypothetical protein